MLIPHENPTRKSVILSNEMFDSIAKEYGCSDRSCEIAMAEPEEGLWHDRVAHGRVVYLVDASHKRDYGT